MALRKMRIIALSITVTMALASASCASSVQLSIDASPGTGYAPCGVHFEAVIKGHNGNGTNFVWDFGDGTDLAEGRTVDHVYTQPGVFTATLTMIQGNGKNAQQYSVTQAITVESRVPEPSGDAYAVDEDTTLEVPAAVGVLANDLDPAGSPITAALAEAPAHGAVTLAADGGFAYRPAPNFYGADRFSYRARNAWTQSEPAAVAVEVKPVNVPPMISDWSPEGKAVFLPVGNGQTFSVEAWDADEEALAYQWRKDGQDLEGATAESFAYAPTNADGGIRTIEVVVTDIRGGTTGHSWQVTVLGVPEAVGPSGEVNSLQPIFSWKAVEGATAYEVAVQSSGGGRVGELSTTSTNVKMFAPLVAGQGYRWEVRARMGTEVGAWSSFLYFTPLSPLTAPVQIGPSGTVESLQPTFAWNLLEGATSYDVSVQNAGGGLFAMFSTSATSARMTSPLLSGQLYRWQVRARIGEEMGTWSPVMYFTPFSPLTAPVQIGPSGIVESLQPISTWNPIEGATSYDVAVQNSGGGLIAMFSTSTTSARMNSPLVGGQLYRWQVRARIGEETGTWSPVMYFTPFSPLTAPVQIGPSGTVESLQPTFTWNPIEGATNYDIFVLNAGGGLMATISTAGTSAKMPFPLSAGQLYKWQMRGRIGDEIGAWSALMTFTPQQ